MKPSDLKTLIKSRVQNKIMRALLIEGSPGLGKTQLVHQVAQELGIDFKVIHAPLMQPEDYGFPIISADKKTVNFIASLEKFPLENSPCGDSGLLLIDELPQCDQNAQKILANLLQEREIHGQKLKPNWFIVATGNKVTDGAGANRILSHLGNRVTRIDIELSLDDWTNWAFQNSIPEELIAFIRFRPELLNKFDKQCDINPTPRAWCEGVAASFGTLPADLEFQTYKGDVGEGPAAEFLGFLKIYRELPSPDAIILNPDAVKVPTDGATLYALCSALSRKAEPNNFAQLMKYIDRLPAEFTVLFVKDATRKNPKLSSCTAFTHWIATTGAKILN